MLKLGDGWTLDEKFLKASNSGRFVGLFPADNGLSKYPYIFTATLFNSSLDDMGNTFNDIKLSKSFDVAGSKITAVGGLFTGIQNVAQTWFWNQYNMTMAGFWRASGECVGLPTATPVATGFETWGGRRVHNYDVQYTQTSPWLGLTLDSGAWLVDASVRSDKQKAAAATPSKGSPTTKTWDL